MIKAKRSELLHISERNDRFLEDPLISGNSVPIKATTEEELPVWFAVYTRSCFEKKMYNALQKTGSFEAFLPLVKECRPWSDRIKTVWVPLLPSYVFVKIPREKISQIYYYPGFVRIISFGGQPCAIREEEICLLEKIVQYGFRVEQTACCKVGDRVRIIRGPLKGWEGRVDSKRGADRIVFHLDDIQQAIGVEVETGDIEKI